ncbi:TonB-dependent receptor family protein [Imbroritus primus]|uniref:TonB-dependent receptor family protein n=1 Tax=Imbroritus primus TaxID=3058603 RepID=UPI003D1608B6
MSALPAFFRPALSVRPARLNPRPRAALTPLVLAMLGGTALAQPAQPVDSAITAALPEVTVQGSREGAPTQPGIGAARATAARVPGGATVVDTETAREGRVSTLTDTLGYAPGVLVQSRFGAEEARISIRGSGLQRTFHGRGLLVLQDGIPINLADGSFDMQAIEPLAARYINVYRGANALQYGAATLGGAIDYVSATGADQAPLEVRVEGGSDAYRRVHVGAAGASDTAHGPIDYALSVSTFDQDGFRRHARQSTQRAIGQFGWQITPDLDTRFYLGAVHSRSELPGNLTLAQVMDDPRQANAQNVAQNQKRDLDLFRLANRTSFRIDDVQRVDVGGYWVHKELFHPIFQVLDQNSDDVGLSLRYQLTAPLFGRPNRLAAGVQFSRGVLDEDRWVNVSGRRGARTNQNRQTALTASAYLDNQWSVTDAVALTGGVQFTRATRRLDDRFIAPGEASDSFDMRYTAWSPRIGVLVDVAPRVQVYGNLSRSVEPPTFSELAGGLNPIRNAAQRAWTAEIGTRGELPLDNAKLGWDVSAYHAELRGELLATVVNGITQTRNAGRTLHQGVEAGLWGETGPWRTRIAALVNRFRFDGDRVYGNNALPGVPRALLRAELTYRFREGLLQGVYAGLTGEWQPGSYAMDMANTFSAPSYAIWGVKLGQQVNRQWSWFVEGRNLSDRRYVATTGIVPSMAGRDGAQFLPGDGRSVYAGVQYRY